MRMSFRPLQDPIRLRAKITPVLNAAGVPFFGEEATPSAAQPVDVADELRKLAGLRDDGIITEDEFQEQKAKLLAR